MTKIFGIAFKPRREIEQKRKILKDYLHEHAMFSKDEIIIEQEDNYNLEKYSPGDTVVFVGLKDLFDLKIYNTVRDLTNKKVIVIFLPYSDK